MAHSLNKYVEANNELKRIFIAQKKEYVFIIEQLNRVQKCCRCHHNFVLLFHHIFYYGYNNCCIKTEFYKNTSI